MKHLWTKKSLVLATNATDPSNKFLSKNRSVSGISIDDRTLKKGDGIIKRIIVQKIRIIVLVQMIIEEETLPSRIKDGWSLKIVFPNEKDLDLIIKIIHM